MTKLDQLPSELISQILDHVTEKKDRCECQLINKRFSVEMPWRWRSLKILNTNMLTDILTTMMTSPYNPSQLVRYVRIGARISDTALLELMAHVPNLEVLLLENANALTDTSSQLIPHHCPQIKELAIWINMSGITNVTMKALGQHAHHLETLVLQKCHGFGTAMFAMLHGCPLTKIDFNGCQLLDINKDNADQNIFAAAADEIILALATGFPHLNWLRFENGPVDHTFFIRTANTHGLVWPHLECLWLTGCYTLDDDTAIPFIQAHPQLRYLQLRYGKLTDRTLVAIADHLKYLRALMVEHNRGFTADGFIRFLNDTILSVGNADGISCTGCGFGPEDLGDELLPFIDDYATELDDNGDEKFTWLVVQYNWRRIDSMVRRAVRHGPP